ncbi:MAG: HAD-IB family hydrolase [Candidatus Nanopelagicales bacterium]
MVPAAVFDLDNTLVRGSSLFHFGCALAAQRVISPMHVLRYGCAEVAYVRHRGERDGLPMQLTGRLLRLVEGRSQEDLCSRARHYASTALRHHLAADVLNRLVAFQKLGVDCYLATASPQDLADAIATELGMSGAIGTVAEVRAGRYTGALASPIAHGAEKARRVMTLFDAWGYDPSTAWAFSDSINDLPLLALVGNPVVVNGDRNLVQIAELNHWSVMVSDGVQWVARPESEQALP